MEIGVIIPTVLQAFTLKLLLAADGWITNKLWVQPHCFEGTPIPVCYAKSKLKATRWNWKICSSP